MKHKKCLSCQTRYKVEESQCPNCGSISFAEVHGPLPEANSFSSDTPNLALDIAGTVAEVALACASTVGEVVGNTFNAISDIDFGGGGAGDLFD